LKPPSLKGGFFIADPLLIIHSLVRV
jgi:hypothetical protein